MPPKGLRSRRSRPGTKGTRTSSSCSRAAEAMGSPSRRRSRSWACTRRSQGAAFDVGVPVLELIAKGQLAFTVDQQAYLQGSMSICELFLYNITGRADNAHRRRHRLQVRDQGQCRRLHFTDG